MSRQSLFSAVVLSILCSIGCTRSTPDSVDGDIPPRADAQTEAPDAAEQDPVSSGSDEISSVPVSSTSDWSQVDDPSRDGWKIEVLAEKAKKAFYKLAHAVLDEPSKPQAESLAELRSNSFQGAPLIPPTTVEVFRDELFQVERWNATDAAIDATVDPSNTFAETVQGLAKAWSEFEKIRYEFKVIKATKVDDHRLNTHVLVAIAGNSADNSLEQHAKWVADWEIASDTHALRLASLRVVDFEQTRINSSAPLFADMTNSVFGKEAAFQAQLLYGMNHWLERSQDVRYFSPLGNPGVSIGDVNNDGRDDIYVCQEANLPNRLFIQQPDGTAREASAAWQVDFLEASRGALLLDLDNDGDQDLAVSIMGAVIIASNEGSEFRVRDVLKSDDDTTSLIAADYDLDGDLDLYVCVDYPNEYFALIGEESESIVVQGGAANRVYHDANNAGRNSLYRNDIQGSNWSFRDVTKEVGLDQDNRRFSWAAAWEDYDNDGDQDLYVANDFGRNCLYENENGRFRNIAAELGIEDSAAGMSVAWDDVDRDERMDIYVANMFSSAGSRITEQPEFKKSVDVDTKQRWRQFAMGNTLFQNSDTGFRDTSDSAAVRLGRWSWSSNFLDVNNDGWSDIAVANGYITSDDTSDL